MNHISIVWPRITSTLTRGKGSSKSTEEMNFPKGLSFLRDTTVIVALSMAVIYI
ncbi:PTS transporter subunit IIC, partial [Microbacterium gubbeenense]|uniref:PTS transporter subunit IIC n=1 Tax=Microbacterium gubbeenense TaxID=159896 RepID=UPI003F983B8E